MIAFINNTKQRVNTMNNKLVTFKRINHLSIKDLSEMLGVSEYIVKKTLSLEDCPTVYELAILGLERSKDRVSSFVSVEIKSHLGGWTATKEGKDRKKYGRDYYYNHADDALRVCREYVNAVLPYPPKSVSGTCIDNGGKYVFTLEF